MTTMFITGASKSLGFDDEVGQADILFPLVRTPARMATISSVSTFER